MRLRTALLTIAGKGQFDNLVELATGRPLTGQTVEVVQVNIGLRCNLACRHCHVQSSPTRQEQMSWGTMTAVLDAAQRAGAHTLDITGGAPEMHPLFHELVGAALRQGLHVMVRTNLTIMREPGYVRLPNWFADRGVHLVASLPCYIPTNVDRQRGRHVFHESVQVIRRLNSAGYAKENNKQLDLVYNPLGATLPPTQKSLEEAYRLTLFDEYDIRFNRLHAITNVPIGRFLRDLQLRGKDAQYLELLRNSFNPHTLDSLMCRNQLHVGWNGTLYDCDFNYALGLPAGGRATHVRDFDPQRFPRRQIATGEHCLACTAGHGSSCGGELLDDTQPSN